MSISKQLNLPPSPLQSDSLAFAPSETPRKSLTEWDEIPAKALGRSGISNKAAALAMGKSESWVSRALRGLEKLGWNDIGTIADPLFYQALCDLIADFYDVAVRDNAQARSDAEIGRRVREVMGLLK
jgi:hypothetical protein